MINLDFFAVIGFIGQGLFSMRFIIQWIASERAGRSVIPFSFWIFSLGGSVLLLTYAIYRKDAVFILGQAPNVLIYSRNIYLLKKGRATEEGDMIEN